MATSQLLPWQTIQIAFEQLGRRVSTALRTQVGDKARLNFHREECLRFRLTMQMVSSDYYSSSSGCL